MKNCRDIEPLKAPYVEGEAGPDERSAVDAHIDQCGRCRHEVGEERAARDVLAARREELRATAPERLRNRCAAHATASSTAAQPAPVVAARRPIYRRWVPMSVAATLVLAMIGVFMLGLTDKAQALAFQTTIDHVKCARFAGDATHVDNAAAGQRWSAVYGWPLRVAPSSQASSLSLRAVRRCAVTDGRVAHLIYEWQGQPLSVYVLPSEVLRRQTEVRRFGHDAVMYSQNGRTYVVLSRAPRRSGLDRVVRYMQANVY